MSFKIEQFVDRCVGKSYLTVKESLIAAGFYQNSARPVKNGDNGKVVWWHGKNEYRGKLTVTYSWNNVGNGISIPGKVVSAEWVPPMRG